MQVPLQLEHAFLLDIDALEDPYHDSHPDPDLESIEALALSNLSSLPTSDTLNHHYH
jgi:hypothetical protein